MRKYRMIAMVTLVAVGLVSSACARQPAAPSESEVTVTTIDGFALQGDPKSAIEFSGNDQIFSGTVVGLGSPRKVTTVTPAGDKSSYIYTPVLVEVDQVLKGDRENLGKQVTIRVIGGQVGKERTVSELNPAPAAYRDGMKVVLFTQDFVDAGDGLSAATPNFSYARDEAGNAYNMLNPDLKTGHDSLLMQVSEWVAFNS
jgi:hypothetical protein